MLRRKKLLVEIIAVLTIISMVSPVGFTQGLADPPKSGWDYIQNTNDNKGSSSQNYANSYSSNTNIYTEGDIAQGVLNVSNNFTAFPQDKLISMKLDNTDVRSVIYEIAREGGKNIILDNSVDGTVSSELEGLSLNKAMDLILTSADLEARIIGDTIFIASKMAMARKGLNRRYVKTFKLNYANALDIASVLSASIFNRGVAITSQASETGNTTSGNSMQATNLGPVFDDGGTVINTGDNTPVNQDGTLQISPNTQTDQNANNTQNATIEGTSAMKGQIGLGTARPVRTIDYVVDSPSGYNDAKKLAGEVRIMGFGSKMSTYQVDNNHGGPIAIPDTRTNSVLIAGLEEDILTAQKTIEYLDKPLKQVSIEVSLVEMNRTDAQDLGIIMAGNSAVVSGGFNSVNPLTNGNVQTPNSFTNPSTNMGIPYDPYNATTFAKSVGLTTLLGQNAIQLSTIKNLTSDITVKLNALLTKNKLKVIANPNIIAQDNSESLIKLTSQIINRLTVTQTQTSTTTSQELADVGIVLNVMPKISEDGYITMRIRPSITSPGDVRNIDVAGSTNEITLINTREIIIQDVRVKSGETLAIGGLVSERSQSTEFKVPIASEIPLIGGLFRQSVRNKSKTELVILVTPKIIDDIATKVTPLKPGEAIPIN